MPHQPQRPDSRSIRTALPCRTGYPAAFGSAAGPGFHWAHAPERRR